MPSEAIAFSGIFEIVCAGLSAHIFSAVGIFRQQIQGAGIGSQISPSSLRNLAVTLVETAWFGSIPVKLFLARQICVSIFYRMSTIVLPWFSIIAGLCSFGFLPTASYLVETVDGNQFSGFQIDPPQRTAAAYITIDYRQIRDAQAAHSCSDPTLAQPVRSRLPSSSYSVIH